MGEVRLIVGVEAGEPISGWLSPEYGERERFVGLLELLAALDRHRGSVRAAVRSAAADRSGVAGSRPDRG